MQIGLIALSMGFVATLTYVIYQIFEEAQKMNVEMTKDRLIENSRHIERKIESLIAVEERKTLKKYRDMMNRSILAQYYINIYILGGVAAAFAIVIYRVSSRALNQTVAGLLLSGIAFCLPFIALEIEVALNDRKIRQHMPHFLLMYLQSAEVMGDSIKALVSIRDNIKDPIKTYVKEFLININRMSNKEAVEILKVRSTNQVWQSFCENLFSDLEYGKMIQVEIENDIADAFMHQENYLARITENTGSLTSIGIILVICVVGLKRVYGMDPDFMNILRNSTEGHVVVNAVIVVLILVGWLARKSIAYTDD